MAERAGKRSSAGAPQRDEDNALIVSFLSQPATEMGAERPAALIVESASLGGVPIAMATHDEAVLALVSSSQGETSLVDLQLETQDQVVLPLDFAATTLLKYSDDKGGGALAFSHEGTAGLAQIVFDELKPGQAGVLSRIRLDTEIERVEEVSSCDGAAAARPRALITYAGGGLGVLDLDTDSHALSSALPGIDTSRAVVTTSRGDAPCAANVWVPVLGEPVLYRVQFLLDDQAPILRVRRIDLPDEPQAIVALDSGTAIVHASTMGRVSFVGHELESDTYMHEGFLANELGDCP